MARGDCAAAALLLYKSNRYLRPSLRLDGQLSILRMADCGGNDGCRPGRHRQRRTLAANHETTHRLVFEAPAHRKGSLRLRISLAAHVPADYGLWTQGRRHGGDQ